MSDAERFPFKKVAVAAYLPTVLFAIGEGALLPYLPVVAGNLGATLAMAGVIAGLMVVGELGGSIPGGLLVARLGERAVMIYAGLATLVAIAAAWFATEIWMLAIAVLVMGVATAIFALARHAFMTTFVPYRYRARALSALGGTFRLGMFVGPLISSLLITIGLPAQSAFIVFFIGCAIAVVVLLFLPDPSTTFERGEHHEGALAAKREESRLIPTVRRYGKTLATVGLGAALLAFVRRGRDVMLPLWAVSIGVEQATTGLVLGLVGAIDFMLFFVSGIIMDRFGRLWSVVPSIIGLGIGFAGLALSHDVSWAFVAFCIAASVLSIANGLGSGILMTVGADLADRSNPAPFLGAWRVVTNSGAAIAPLAIAAIIQLATIAWAAGALVVACALGAFVMAKTLPDSRKDSGEATDSS